MQPSVSKYICFVIFYIFTIESKHLLIPYVSMLLYFHVPTTFPPHTTPGIDCPINTYGAKTGLIAASKCTGCGIGLYSNDKGSNSAAICIKCQKGKKQSLKIGSPQDCSTGMYQDELGQSSCKFCPIGTFASLGGREICTDCAAGRISVSAQDSRTTCKDCDAAKYQTEDGQSACVDCEVGRSRSSEGSANPCLTCSPGQYNNKIGQRFCEDCPVGYIEWNQESISCTKCEIGKYMARTRQDDTECVSLY